MNKLTLEAKIEEKGIKYIEPNWQDKFAYFLEKNKGSRIEVVMNKVSDVRYHTHKYYRGYLLLDITEAMGETSKAKVHFDLKKEFLYSECTCIEEIPSKHRSSCQIGVKENQVVGYAPSMKTLTIEDAKRFILECEKRLFIDLGSHIGVSAKTNQLKDYQEEAKYYRDKVFNDGTK